MNRPNCLVREQNQYKISDVNLQIFKKAKLTKR